MEWTIALTPLVAALVIGFVACLTDCATVDSTN